MACLLVMNALEKRPIRRIGDAGGLVRWQFYRRESQAERAEKCLVYGNMHTDRKVHPWRDGSGEGTAQA